MEILVYCFVIAAIAFWLGRKTKPSSNLTDDSFADSAILTKPPQTGTARIPMNGTRLFSLIFISMWIVAWSVGISMALLVFLNSYGDGPVSLFMGCWLIAAIAGWALAANTIYRLATGRPVKMRGGRTY